MIVLGSELIKGGWPMTAIATQETRFDQGARCCHPSPEIALVHLMTEHMFVCLLKFGKSEQLWQEMKRDVGIAKLGLEADKCVVEYRSVDVVMNLDFVYRTPVHPIVGGLMAGILPE
jgi:hypothetical protein